MAISKLARYSLGTILCVAIGFISMVFAAMAFLNGMVLPFVLLGAIWVVYLILQILQWEFVSNVWLSAFVGFGTGLLRESDQFSSYTWAKFLAWLPNKWIGLVGLAFYFIFVALLPWLATNIARRLTSNAVPSQYVSMLRMFENRGPSFLTHHSTRTPLRAAH